MIRINGFRYKEAHKIVAELDAEIAELNDLRVSRERWGLGLSQACENSLATLTAKRAEVAGVDPNEMVCID